jgi:predicted PurR-regulated permease PerM
MFNTKILFWGILAIILGYFVNSVSSILTPFIASMVIAYFLDPLTAKLEKIGIKRYFTVLIIVTIFVLFLSIILIRVAPALLEQIQQFIITIPRYEDYVTTKITTIMNHVSNQLSPELSEDIQQQLSKLSTKFFSYVALIIRGIFNSGIAVINILSLIILTPILVFYLLRDWPILVCHFNKLLPRNSKAIITDQLKQIDKVLSAYVRGQINICLILSLFYIITLGIMGLNYYLLIGTLIGCLTIIPYLGFILGGTLCIVVALLQYSDIDYIYITLAIFLLGHLLESYILIPKLIGNKVGLHPVWVLFALMTGGVLFGFWGVFFAIPIAAIIAVLVRSALKIYLSSQMYKH